MKRTTICLLLLAAVIGSCSKSQTETSDPQSPQSLTVERARAFFTYRLDSITANLTTKTLTTFEYSVNWDDAIEGHRTEFDAIEAPLLATQDFYDVTDGKCVKALKRALIVKFTSTGNISAYILTILPSLEYEQSNPDYASHVGHSSDNTGFSGVFRYNSLRGDFVKIVVWYKGIQTGSFYTPNVTIDNYPYVNSRVSYLMHSIGNPLTKVEGEYTGNNNDGYCYTHAVVITPDHPRECSIPYPGGYPPMMEPDPEDGGGGGGGWTPPSIPQAPLTFTQTMAQYALDRILKDGKVNISSVTDGMFGKEINRINMTIGGRSIFVYNFNLGFGDISSNYAVSSLSDGHYVPAANADGERWFMHIHNQDGRSIGSITIGIGDRDFVQQTFSNAPKK